MDSITSTQQTNLSKAHLNKKIKEMANNVQCATVCMAEDFERNLYYNHDFLARTLEKLTPIVDKLSEMSSHLEIDRCEQLVKNDKKS